jgi:hypothetical protein
MLTLQLYFIGLKQRNQEFNLSFLIFLQLDFPYFKEYPVNESIALFPKLPIPMIRFCGIRLCRI